MKHAIHSVGRLFMRLGATAMLYVLAGQTAWAVPSFSRQSGLSCDTCHTVAPQLTTFGRLFKINGYVMSAATLSPKSSGDSPAESIGSFPPLSAMVQVSDTELRKAAPDPGGSGGRSQNHSVEFPQQLSLFYAGRIADHLGAFVQATYEGQSDHFGMDNADIRYANATTLFGQGLQWGLTLNNNPTVDDPWNSVPAWSFPYVASGNAPTPSAAPLITGLGQQVAGLGAYAWIDNTWYLGLSGYRSAQIGTTLPLGSTASGAVSGVAPYVRLAWEHNWSSGPYTHSLEVGGYGMAAHLYPTGVTGATDNYIDAALDSQYQLLLPSHDSLDVHARVIHENQKRNATFAAGGSSNRNDSLTAWSVNAQYYWHEKFGPSAGYFLTTGSHDALLYSGAPSASPGAAGWVLQWTYLPWQNVQLAAQYTIYTRFDGGGSNYDGGGRNASDNDTLYAMLWLLW